MEQTSFQEQSFPSQNYQLALEYPISTASLSISLPEVLELPEVEKPPEQPIEVISIYPTSSVEDKPFKTKNGHGTIFHPNANGDLSMSSIETSPKRINGDVSKEGSPKRDSLISKDNSPKRESRAKHFSRSIQNKLSTFGIHSKRKNESSKKDVKEFVPMQETHSTHIWNNANVLCNGSIQKPPSDGHRTPSRSSSPQPGPSGNGNVRNPSKAKRGPRGRYELVGMRCNSPEVEITVEPTDLDNTDAHNGRLIPDDKEQASLRKAADRGTKFIAVFVIVLFITLVVLLLKFA